MEFKSVRSRLVNNKQSSSSSQRSELECQLSAQVSSSLCLNSDQPVQQSLTPQSTASKSDNEVTEQIFSSCLKKSLPSLPSTHSVTFSSTPCSISYTPENGLPLITTIEQDEEFRKASEIYPEILKNDFLPLNKENCSFHIKPDNDHGPDSSILSPNDFALIELIKQFNYVFDWNISPSANMIKLLEIDHRTFSLSTDIRKLSEDEDIFITAVDNINLGTFIGIAETEPESREKSFIQPFLQLKKINDVLASFKQVYSPYKSPDEYMDKLIEQNQEMITVKVQHNSNMFKVYICLWNSHCFIFSRNSLKEAKLEAFEKISEFLNVFSKLITFSYTPQVEQQPEVKLSTGGQQILDLIIRFHFLCARKTTYEEVIKEMVDTNKAFTFTTKKSWDRKKDTQAYEVRLVNPHLGSFSCVLHGKHEARNGARKQAFDRLQNHINLLQYFTREYSPDKDMKAFVKKMIDENDEVLKEIKIKKFKRIVRASIIWVNVGEFFGESKIENEDEAIDIALEHLIDTVRYMSDRFHAEANKSICVFKQSLRRKKYFPFIDPMIIKRTIILKEFNRIFSLDKSWSQILDELNQTVTIRMRTEFMPDVGEYFTILDLFDIAVFYSSNQNPDESRNKVMKQAVDFLLSMVKLIADFKSIRRNTLSPMKVIEQLSERNFQLIKVKNASVNAVELEGIPQLHLTIIQLQHMALFAKTDSDQFESKKGAMSDAYDYLERLSNAIHTQL